MTTYPPPVPDYYALLGVDPAASPAEITRAFHALMKRYHAHPHAPNAQVDWETEMIIKEVKEAYAVLSDSILRWRYDELRLDALTAPNQISQRLHKSGGVREPEDDDWQSGLLFSAYPGQHLLSLLQQRLFARTSGRKPNVSRTAQKQMMGALSKAALFPAPFCVATAVSAFFWHLGQVTGHIWLAGLTAVLAYPLLLLPLLVRLMLPIRYRPLLSLKQKVVVTPLIFLTALLLGWLWVVLIDHSGTRTSPFDLYWWCALISAVGICLAYF